MTTLKEQILKDTGWLIAEAVVLLFVGLSFSMDILGLYGFMIVIDYMLLMLFANKLTVYDNSQLKNTPLALLKAVMVYFGFLWLTFFVTYFFSGITNFGQSTQAVFSTFSATVLPLADNPIMIFFVFAILIARRETRIFIRMLEAVAIIFKIPFELKNKGRFNLELLIMAIAFSVGFMFFHIRTRDIQNQAAWFITFLFMLVTYAMLFIKVNKEKKEMEAPVYLHMINNALAVANKLQGYWLFKITGLSFLAQALTGK